MNSKKERADVLLVRAGVAETEQEALALIMAGKILATDAKGRESKVEKPGTKIDSSSTFRNLASPIPFVSRGGIKLAHALDAFGVDPKGRVCADFGISTGGFSDCLLSRGAARIYGVDVGYGQTAWKIRNDPRVVLLERQNARLLEPSAFGEKVDLCVIDLSFISLSSMWPAVLGQLEEKGEIVALLKPQFEVQKEDVPFGVVESEEARRGALFSVKESAKAAGLVVLGECVSPIEGADGNVEYFLHLGRAS